MVSNSVRAVVVIIVLLGVTITYIGYDINPNNLNDGDSKDNVLSKETISQVSETTQSSQSTLPTSSNTETSSETQVPTINKNYSLILKEIIDVTSASPVGIRNANDGSNRLFLIDQSGKILVLNNNSGIIESKVFLDITTIVNYQGEKGLLGLAFHPTYENNGYFYVNYVSSNPNLRTIVSRFSVDPSNANSALSNSELVILEINQPADNHNGGDLLFGLDGYLYISMGDGGGSGDKYKNGQNPSTLLGSILRIDVDNTSSYGNYAIPADNPFNDNSDGYKEEIYAFGMRNPWRMSIDSQTGLLWVGDVGQNRYEEVDIVLNGKNYGWPIMEGFHCYSPADCDMTDLELPVQEYGRTLGTTVTGGYVYRGKTVTSISGQYIFADYGSGHIWSIDSDDPTQPSKLLFDTDINISSFGEDEDGELYLTSLSGKIYIFGQVEI